MNRWIIPLLLAAALEMNLPGEEGLTAAHATEEQPGWPSAAVIADALTRGMALFKVLDDRCGRPIGITMFAELVSIQQF